MNASFFEPATAAPVVTYSSANGASSTSDEYLEEAKSAIAIVRSTVPGKRVIAPQIHFSRERLHGLPFGNKGLGFNVVPVHVLKPLVRTHDVRTKNIGFPRTQNIKAKDIYIYF